MAALSRRTPLRTPSTLPSTLTDSGADAGSISRLPQLPLNLPSEHPAALKGKTRSRDRMLEPRDAERFQCIGPQCEDSCCRAWDLRLDRATYERYQLIPAESLLGKVARECVVQVPEPRSEQMYGRILLNAKLDCPFLTEEKWCGVQQAFGAEALSPTCRTYPRIEHWMPDGRVETTLHLSCPEAARVILLHETVGQSVAEDYEAIAAQVVEWMEAARAEEMPEIVLDATRRFLLRLLRDRRYSLGERLLLMRIFAGRLGGMIGRWPGHAATEFPSLLREFCLLARRQTLRPALAAVASQPVQQLALALGMVNSRLERTMNSLRFLDAVKMFLDGIGYRPGRTPEDLAPAWQQAEKEFFVPWIAAHPWFLENYLEQAVYRTLFPFGKEGKSADPEGEFLALSTHFIVLRTLLIGVAGACGASFGSAEAVLLVQSYSRMIDHHAEFLKAASGALATHGWTDLGSLAGLLLECAAGRPECVGAVAMA